MARSVLAGLFVLLLAGFSTHVPPQPAESTSDKGDASLFRAVVERIQAGEPYYRAMGQELRGRGYPSASIFNWRTPFVLTVVGAAPRVAAWVLIGLSIFSVLATLVLLLKAPPEVLLTGLLLQVGAATSVLLIPAGIMVAEVWAGYLLFVSVVAYARGWRVAGVTFAVFALFVRELAAPYCVVGSIVAVIRRRWTEAALWATGVCAYAAYFAAHAFSVEAQLGAVERAQSEAWVQFSGLPFVLATLSFNGWFAALPDGAAAISCVLVVAALWAEEGPLQLRIAAVAYLLFFSIVGQMFNQYWGLVAAPAWALSCGYGVAGLQRLIVSARPTTSAIV